ncbi:Cytochrome P450 86B1 [Acorus gramineus]|uniref:Cytochrome P450 86B1 n=1 Tax=Acorus gramineus TaxID=55184 RepID=A0AAV9AJJ1_ACOGR|nr:Cytochrome P450 86B1 [Acorus gramineus]
MSFASNIATTMLGLLKSHPEILLALSCFLLLRQCLGMLPRLLGKLHRVHDYCAEVVRASGLTLLFKGPILSKLDFIVTCDPANANHILKSAFADYQKGPDFPEIFDVLGEGIIVADDNSWASQRKSAHALFADAKFRGFVAEMSKGMVESALVPILTRAAELGEAVDLEDVFLRFTFDSSCKILIGVDSNSLSDGFPEVSFVIAIEVAEEVVLLRHATPMWWWKLMRWLNVGPEKTLARARETIDAYVMQTIREKREAICEASSSSSLPDMLSVYLQNGHDDKFLRDMVLNFMIAGRDTTAAGLAWFFWLMSKNPHVETKIYEELKARFGEDDVQQFKVFDAESLHRLVYLHAALYEALRLYPPVPYNHKWAAKADELPSGVLVEPGTRILISMYAMGRMKEVWGEDCGEFTPKRWITKHGTVKYEPPHKFLAFNAGPRSCLGKDMALTQMMVVAAAMIYNFKVEAVEGHVVEPRISVILHLKNGFLAKVRKRRDC